MCDRVRTFVLCTPATVWTLSGSRYVHVLQIDWMLAYLLAKRAGSITRSLSVRYNTAHTLSAPLSPKNMLYLLCDRLFPSPFLPARMHTGKHESRGSQKRHANSAPESNRSHMQYPCRRTHERAGKRTCKQCICFASCTCRSLNAFATCAHPKYISCTSHASLRAAGPSFLRTLYRFVVFTQPPLCLCHHLHSRMHAFHTYV